MACEVSASFCQTFFEKITTQNLPRLLQEWKTTGRRDSLSQDASQRRNILIDMALDQASSFINKWCSDTRQIERYPRLRLSICLSLAILGESLDSARKSHFADLQPYPRQWQPSSARFWGKSKLLKNHMLSNGWCPFRIDALENDCKQRRWTILRQFIPTNGWKGSLLLHEVLVPGRRH